MHELCTVSGPSGAAGLAVDLTDRLAARSSLQAGGTCLPDNFFTATLIVIVSLACHDGPRLLFELSGNDNTDEEQIRGSVTFLLDGLHAGATESLEELWARCFATVVRLARQRLGSASRRVSDEDDVAASVFYNLFDACQSGRLPELRDRESLWRLLITMTSNQAKNVLRDQRREKRGRGRV